MRPFEVSALVDAINVRHATSFVLLHRYGSGDGTGAYRLEGGGQTYVLKCVRGNDTGEVDRAETATTFLRGRGYPAPEYLAVGSVGGAVYEVQTALPGRHIGSIGPRVHYLEQALALNDLQADGPALGGPPWPAPVVDPVLRGGKWGATMSSHSPATASLLAELQDVVETNLGGVPTDRHDVVHFDFHADNILATPERITGVIDWQPVTGDRTFDLMQLAYGEGAWGDWSIVLPGLIERAGEAAARVYGAYLILTYVEWGTLHYQHRVEAGIGRARALLDALAATAGE
jgi:aminoglycoside phosphotransferase (APT) family kinase protein